MSELDHLTDEQLAARARALLMDPMLIDALQSVEDQAVAMIKDSGPMDSQVREMAYHKLKSAEDLREALKEYITNYRLASRK